MTAAAFRISDRVRSRYARTSRIPEEHDPQRRPVITEFRSAGESGDRVAFRAVPKQKVL